jgi:predicted enzyme related to lactoylglutathione lyase
MVKNDLPESPCSLFGRRRHDYDGSMSSDVPGPATPAGVSPISRLRIRVADVDRAADFYGHLFGWKFDREQSAMHAEQRLVQRRAAIPGAIGAVFVDDPREPPVRVEFEVPDVTSAMARVLRLGGSGDAAAAFDDQGVPLALAARDARPEADDADASHIGVVVLQAPDTAKACAFQAGLFQRTFHEVGAGGRWWVDHLALGIFPGPPAVRFWCVVDALEPAIVKVSQLGGKVLERDSMGPYQVCDCLDDQGTAFGLWYDPFRPAP